MGLHKDLDECRESRERAINARNSMSAHLTSTVSDLSEYAAALQLSLLA